MMPIWVSTSAIRSLPSAKIVDDSEHAYSDSTILYVIEVHEHLAPEPLAELRAGIDRSELSIYKIAARSGRHGVLLGSNRWQPSQRLCRPVAVPVVKRFARVGARPVAELLPATPA